jgi:hypothetical protein
MVVLKLCRRRLARVLLLYLWRKCLIPCFFSTFFLFQFFVCSLLPWGSGTCGEVETQDHCQIELFYCDVLALKRVLLTTFICWGTCNRIGAFVDHIQQLDLLDEQWA